jgi:putative ATPase
MEPTEATLPLFGEEPARPLADRLRPTQLEDVVGQDHLLAPDAPLGRMVAQQRLGSAILWGPPGVGKTTIARLLAEGSNLAFESVSATPEKVADLRKVFATARSRRGIGQGTLLFVDEIHRFNRAQQDSFLPYVEDGTVTLDRVPCPGLGVGEAAQSAGRARGRGTRAVRQWGASPRYRLGWAVGERLDARPCDRADSTA